MGEYSLEIEEDVINDATQGQQAFSFLGELSKGRNTHGLLAWQYFWVNKLDALRL